MHIWMRSILHPQPGVSEPIYLGEAKRNLTTRDGVRKSGERDRGNYGIPNLSFDLLHQTSSPIDCFPQNIWMIFELVFSWNLLKQRS
jgi:hypothetical protein